MARAANVMLTFVVLCEFHSPSMAVRIDADEHSGNTSDVPWPFGETQPEWSSVYTACNATCGLGDQTLIMFSCMLSGKVVPEEQCHHLPEPARTKHGCEHNKGCEWKLAGLAAADGKAGHESFNAGCGWAREVQCVARGGTTPVSNEFCAKIIADSEADFLLKNGLATNKCDGTELQELCVATFRSEESLGDVTKTAKELVTRCGNAAAIVISTQEMTQTRSSVFWDVFSSFAKDLDPYVEVARCGGKISAGVVVLAQKKNKHLFAPKLVHGDCTTNDEAGNSYFAVGILGMRSKQGSVTLQVRTVAGTMVAVSTHGPDGKAGVQNIEHTVDDIKNFITNVDDTRVVWGGSFNFHLAPSLEEFGDLKTLGLTHPDDDTLVDKYSSAKSEFSPSGYYDKLVNIVELFGGGSVAAFQTGIAAGGLAEVDGVKNLCPPGPKTDVPGSEEARGYLSYFNTTKKDWIPNFACKHGDELDYYKNEIEGESHSIPGWTDRLVVGGSITQTCSSPQKVAAPKGYDIVFSICKSQ